MMDSGMISKIEKAKRYASEPHRITFKQFGASIKGENSDHYVQYEDGKWNCTCGYFQTRGLCSHTMAFEIILNSMVEKGEHTEA
ncbi:MAG TPA: SWIM zinc finger family protein [Anaerolineaceae bacterium]|nr:SWIM zinc finger family protein [Anaerolineaceae bacterium]